MSRTGLDAATLAKSLRRITGDGSVEWVMEPMQARVLLDVADMLDESARLREVVSDGEESARLILDESRALQAENAKLRELLDYMTPIAWYAASERERDRMRELGVSQ